MNQHEETKNTVIEDDTSCVQIVHFSEVSAREIQSISVEDAKANVAKAVKYFQDRLKDKQKLAQ